MNVLLVNMPFSNLWPAIGISLLKAQLKRVGFPARVEYFNIRFAERIGVDAYKLIAVDKLPSDVLAGEWVFSHCLFPRGTADSAEYLNMVSRLFPMHFPSETLAILKRSREEANAFLDECLSGVDWRSYDVVGFTTTFHQNIASLALAKRLKKRFPHLCIVFGGANCEEVMGLQLHRSFPYIDFVCSGEADLSFPALLRCLAEKGDVHNIPGVISRRDGRSQTPNLVPNRLQDLDALPFPDYDDFFEQYRRLDQGNENLILPVETSRGCWWGEKHHCTFCGLNGLAMTYRSKSPARALEEVVELARRYGVSKVLTVDNILDMHYFKELLPRFRDRRAEGEHPDVRMFYEVKANLTRDQVSLLGQAGVYALQPGIESLSTHVLQLMRKGTSALQNVQILKWCKELGIYCTWNMLYGFPGEDPAAYQAMEGLIDSLHHLEPPDICSPIRLDRFSPYFTAPEALGMRNVRSNRWYRYVYDLPEEELANLAYYFDFDYADGRDPDDYTEGVRAAIRRWRANAGNRLLLYTDENDRLVIWDFRPGTRQTTTVLTGGERAVYVFCDEHKPLAAIQARARALGLADTDTTALLQRLVDAKLMAAADGRYLSLAILMPQAIAAKAVVSRLTCDLTFAEIGSLP
jgi:ribosomal peptide maturation radical SAM protein 1